MVRPAFSPLPNVICISTEVQRLANGFFTTRMLLGRQERGAWLCLCCCEQFWWVVIQIMALMGDDARVAIEEFENEVPRVCSLLKILDPELGDRPQTRSSLVFLVTIAIYR